MKKLPFQGGTSLFSTVFALKTISAYTYYDVFCPKLHANTLYILYSIMQFLKLQFIVTFNQFSIFVAT